MIKKFRNSMSIDTGFVIIFLALSSFSFGPSSLGPDFQNYESRIDPAPEAAGAWPAGDRQQPGPNGAGAMPYNLITY
jgi:hypothetical protein